MYIYIYNVYKYLMYLNVMIITKKCLILIMIILIIVYPTKRKNHPTYTDSKSSPTNGRYIHRLAAKGKQTPFESPTSPEWMPRASLRRKYFLLKYS